MGFLVPLHVFLKEGLVKIIKIIVLIAEWSLNMRDPNVTHRTDNLTDEQEIFDLKQCKHYFPEHLNSS